MVTEPHSAAEAAPAKPKNPAASKVEASSFFISFVSHSF
jgi:hypothetical protein